MVKKCIVIATLGILSIQLAFGTCMHDSTDFETVSQRRWYSPHYIPIQYAGNIGFISAGIGYAPVRDKFQLSFQYGFAPKSIAGVDIHTLTLRNIFHIYKHNLGAYSIIPYAGMGLSLEVGGRSFFFLPSNMPKGYYKFPKSIHLIPALGVKARHSTERIKSLRAVELFAEVSTVDAYIWYKAISSEVKMRQIISLSVGVNLMKR